MHRACCEQDRNQILQYISSEPEVNLYISGDIDQYGIKFPVSVEAFGARFPWDAIVLSLSYNYVVYSRTMDYSPFEIASYINASAEGNIPRHINARLDIAESLKPFFPEMHLHACRIASLHRAAQVQYASIKVKESEGIVVRKLATNDFDALFELFSHVDETSQGYATVKQRNEARTRKEMSAKAGCVTYGTFRYGKLVSTAATSVASSSGAMITDVATLPAERGNGYASAALYAVCRECFSRGMDYVSLYYENPIAAALYHKLGFIDIDEFGMFGLH
jgi:predicted GNAT family acetyltransferase